MNNLNSELSLCAVNGEKNDGSGIDPYQSCEFEWVCVWCNINRWCSVCLHTLSLLGANAKERSGCRLKPFDRVINT